MFKGDSVRVPLILAEPYRLRVRSLTGVKVLFSLESDGQKVVYPRPDVERCRVRWPFRCCP